MIWTSLIAQGKRQLWMSLFVATLIAVVYFNVARLYQSGPAFWLFALGWVPVLLNVLRAGVRLFYHLDRHPFRALDLGLSKDQVAPGQSFDIEIRAEARRETSLERVIAELGCTRSRSTDRGRKREVLSTDERVLAEGVRLGGGDSAAYRVSLPVPEGAPYSYRSMEGKIAWTVGVSLEVSGWGVIRDELEVSVAPG